MVRNNNHLILWTVLDRAKKEEPVSSVSLFCIKEHIFVIEEEPLSGMCRQLHQMLPCMKSQLVVIDKFPNTSKDFSNYLSPLLKLNSCISLPPTPPHPFFFQGYVRACLSDSAAASRKICLRERDREGEIKREGNRERKKGERERVYVGLACWTYEQTASIYLLLEYRWAGLHY